MKAHYGIESIFWLAIGVYTAGSAYRLGLGRFRQPGPGFIFFLAALLLIVLSIIDLGMTFIGMYKTGKDRRNESVWLGVKWQKVLLVLAGLSIYTYMFDFLGFVLSTFLLMIFLFKAVDPTKLWKSVLGSLITILVSYGVFKLWLKVPFPTGILGF
ncbi:MAG: tripartite tricarboxylate transporter TctB family protein [Thermodesulfobacteriota bacterium]